LAVAGGRRRRLAGQAPSKPTIPQEIHEQCDLLPHTQVRFVVENGRVLIEKESPAATRGQEAVQRLRLARPVRTRLSTDALLALCRDSGQRVWRHR
jgi:hypothetical protein